MISPAWSFKNINWESKFTSILFMVTAALAANIPAVSNWLTLHTNLDASTITGIGMLIGYISKAFSMPTTQPLSIKE